MRVKIDEKSVGGVSRNFIEHRKYSIDLFAISRMELTQPNYIPLGQMPSYCWQLGQG